MIASKRNNHQLPRTRKRSKKFERSRTGCLTCRKKKKKCDGKKPNCERCSRLGLTCEYPKLRFFQLDASKTHFVSCNLKQTFTELENQSTDSELKDLSRAVDIPSSEDETRKSDDDNGSHQLVEILMKDADEKPQEITDVVDKRDPTEQHFNQQFVSELMNSQIDILFGNKTPTEKLINDLSCFITKESEREYVINTKFLAQPPSLNNRDLIHTVLQEQSLFPEILKETFEAITLLDGDQSNSYKALSCWCYLYIHHCDHKVREIYSSSNIKFGDVGKKALAELVSSVQHDGLEYYGFDEFGLALNLLNTLSLTISPIPQDQFYKCLHNSQRFVKNTGGVEMYFENRLCNSMIKYLLYLELTSSYLPSNYIKLEYPDNPDNYPNYNITIVEQMDVFKDNYPLLQVFNDIMCLAERSHSNLQVTEIQSVIDEVESLNEKLVKLSINTSLILDTRISSYKQYLLSFYRKIGKLMLFQLVLKRNSVSFDTALLTRELITRLDQLIQFSVDDKSNNIAVFPLFILAIDIYSLDDREWIIMQFKLLFYKTKNPNIANVLRLIREVWKINDNGYKYVHWPYLAEKLNWLIPII